MKKEPSSYKKELMEQARSVSKAAYAPYSNFKVGAAIEGSNGRIYTGCNVENASYGACCCAERAAVCKAVADGCTKFRAIAVVSSGGKPTFPCGICRQVLAEFSPDIEVLLDGEEKDTVWSYSLGKELIPESFRL